MSDWQNWLWITGEVVLSYGFYRWWKSNETFLGIIEVAPDISIDDLKQFSSLTTTIDYASVHGVVQPKDAKVNSVFQSQFVPTAVGVMHRLTMHEQKLQKGRNGWDKTKDLISNVIRHRPFRLVSPKENFIHIDKPLQFSSIEDQLEVTHVKFEPIVTGHPHPQSGTNQEDPIVTSSIDKLVETIAGKVSTGIETKEKMLLVNTPLTGFGRLEKRSGIWYLSPHEQWGGILSRLSRKEVLSTYRTRSTIAQLLSIILGIVAGCTAAYLICKYYSNWQRRTNRLPTIAPTVQTNENANPNNRLQCIICLENEIIYSLQPCSHLGLCDACAQLLQAGNHERELCPICRAPIQQYQRVFLP